MPSEIVLVHAKSFPTSCQGSSYLHVMRFEGEGRCSCNCLLMDGNIFIFIVVFKKNLGINGYVSVAFDTKNVFSWRWYLYVSWQAL